MIGKLMSGGAGYLLAGALTLISIQGYAIHDLRGDKKELKTELLTEKSKTKGAVSAIKTQAEQAARQQVRRQEHENAVAEINSVPDSENCANSAPVIRAIDWVRAFERAETDANND